MKAGTEKSVPRTGGRSTHARKGITRRIMAFSALTTSLFIFAGGIVGSATMRSTALEQAKGMLTGYVRDRADYESELLLNAESNQRLLGRELTSRLATMGQADADADFNRRVRLYPDGTRRSRVEDFDGSAQAGIFIEKGVIADGPTRLLTSAAADLCEIYGHAWFPRFQNTYVARADGILVLFWPLVPTFAQDAPSLYDLSEEEYVRTAAQAAELGVDLTWTGLYRDRVSGRWMVSCLSSARGPDGKAVAILGQDMSMDELISNATVGRLSGSTVVVFRQDGRVIAHSGMMDRIYASDGKLTVSETGDGGLAEIYSRLGYANQLGSAVHDKRSAALIGVARIKGPDWIYAIKVPDAAVTGSGLQASGFLLLLSAFSIIASGLIIFLMLRTQLGRPLEALADAVDTVSEGDLGAKIPMNGQGELGRLAASVNAMRDSLREDISKLSQVFDLSPSLIGISRASDGKLLACNQAFSEMTGYSPEQLRNASVRDIDFRMAEEERDLLLKAMLSADGVKDAEVRLGGEPGAGKDCVMAARRMSYAGEDAAIFVITDISQLKKAELELRESEERMRLFIERNVVAISIADGSGKILFWNPAIAELSGIPSAEAIGKNWGDIAYRLMPAAQQGPGRREELNRQINSVTGGQTSSPAALREIVFERIDGTSLIVEHQFMSVESSGRRLYFISLRDITEKKRLEEQLRQSQKMESIGRLASGVAHDFNNLLTVIIGNIDMVSTSGRLEDSDKRRLDDTLRAAESATSLTRQLLAFSRKQSIAPAEVDLGAFLRGMRGVLQRLIGDGIELKMEEEAALWSARIDPGQIDQIVMNLAVNARDAMPKGGCLSIGCANVCLDEEYRRLSPQTPFGDYVLLTVSDNGSGMTTEVKERVFEPFFTTKELGRGTGLGLTIVYGAVTQNGGHIDIESEVGVGTTFRIYLPRFMPSTR